MYLNPFNASTTIKTQPMLNIEAEVSILRESQYFVSSF